MAAISTHSSLFSVCLHLTNTQAKDGGPYNLFDLFKVGLSLSINSIKKDSLLLLAWESYTKPCVPLQRTDIPASEF